MDDIISLAMLLLTGWGLYMINDKMGNKHAWLSFIPVVNIYSMVQASGKKMIWVVYILVAMGLMFLSLMFGIVMLFLGLANETILTIGTSLAGLAWLFGLVYVILYLTVLDKISRRTGGGFFRALGFLILPFIVYPIVGYNLKKEDIKDLEENKKEA